MELDPWDVLTAASKKIPIVKYSLALVAFAAAAAILVRFLGNDKKTIVFLLGVSLFGSILLYIFSLAVRSRHKSLQLAGISMVWSVFATFLIMDGLTVAALAQGVPCFYSQLLGLPANANYCRQMKCNNANWEEFWLCVNGG